MKDVPCIMWNASCEKTPDILNLLCEICITHKFQLKTLADYSMLLAHTYYVFAGEGYSEEELEQHLSVKDKRKNYCHDRESLGSEQASLCQICEYSRNYMGKREKLEKTVLYYLITNNEDVICSQRDGKTMFVSKKLINLPGKPGKWPILGFHQEIYNFIFINVFSGVSIDRDNFQDKFMQYMYAAIPSLARDYQRTEEELKEALFFNIRTFIGGHREIEEAEYREALSAINKPYRIYKKEIQKKEEAGRKNKGSEHPQDGQRAMKVSGEIMEDLMKIMKETETVPQEGSKEHIKARTAQNQTKSRERDEKTKSVPLTKDEVRASEQVQEKELRQKPEKDWFFEYPLLVAEDDITLISERYIAALAVKLGRSEYVVVEAAIVDGKAGIILYPQGYREVYYSSDKRMLKNLVQIMGRSVLLCFDVVKLYAFLRKFGFGEKTRAESVSDLYHVYSASKEKFFSVMSREILGRNAAGILNAMQDEYCLYMALYGRLMADSQKKKYRQVLGFQHALSYSYIYETGKFLKISDYAARHNMRFKEVKVAVKGYDSWEELLYKVVNHLWVNGSLQAFKMHFGDVEEGYVVFRYFAGSKEEVADLLSYTFNICLAKEEGSGYEISIMELA